jgi:hypothetical protein
MQPNAWNYVKSLFSGAGVVEQPKDPMLAQMDKSHLFRASVTTMDDNDLEEIINRESSLNSLSYTVNPITILMTTPRVNTGSPVPEQYQQRNSDEEKNDEFTVET